MNRVMLILACVMLLACSAQAGSGISFGLKGGLVDNYDHPGLTLPDHSLERQGLVGGQFYIERPQFVDLILSVDFVGREKSFAIGGDELDLTMRDLAVTASLVYPVHWSTGRFYFGGGAGSHSLSYEYVRPRTLSLIDNGVTIPELSTYFGYHVLAGAAIDVPNTPVGFFVEGKYGKINLPDDDISYNNWSAGIYIMLPE